MSEEERNGLRKQRRLLREKCKNKDKEIEKLKEQNKMLKEAVKEKVIATCNACEDYGICPHSYREFDLDNIIKEVRESAKRELKIAEENIKNSEQWLDAEEEQDHAKRDIHTGKIVKRYMEMFLEILDKGE